MELFLQRLIDGLSDGSVYGLFALAVVLVYRTTGIVNFAQGEMGMICAFIAWQLSDPSDGWGLPLLIAIALAVVFGFFMGAATERIVVRPFLGGDHLRMALVTMGLFLAFNSLASFIFGTTTRNLQSPFGSGTVNIGGVHISSQTLGQFGALAVISLLLWLLFTRTTLGVTLRASSMNPESSRLLGIDVGRNLMVGWGLASALGAVSAILIAPTLYLSTGMMLNVMLYGFTAAVVGGLDSSTGAVLGGLLVGVIQSLASGYIPFVGTQLQLAFALLVVVLVLTLRPQGMLGRARLERV